MHDQTDIGELRTMRCDSVVIDKSTDSLAETWLFKVLCFLPICFRAYVEASISSSVDVLKSLSRRCVKLKGTPDIFST